MDKQVIKKAAELLVEDAKQQGMKACVIFYEDTASQPLTVCKNFQDWKLIGFLDEVGRQWKKFLKLN